MTQKNEVTVKAETAVTPQGKAVGKGFENVDASTITMPRGKLLQSNSPECADRDYNFRAGDVIHTLLMDKVPEKFIPILISDSNIMFVPRADERKASMKAKFGLTDEEMQANWICRAADGKHGDRFGECAKCGLYKFDGAEKPWCNATINILALPLDGDDVGMPVVYQFSNTSFKHGKKFRDGAYYAGFGENLFDRVYKLETVQASGNGNTWYEMKTKPAGKTPPELLERVSTLYDSFAGKIIAVDEEDDSPQENVNY